MVSLNTLFTLGILGAGFLAFTSLGGAGGIGQRIGGGFKAFQDNLLSGFTGALNPFGAEATPGEPLIDLQLSADLAAGRVEEEDVKAMEYPTLEEYDPRMTGVKGSFDLASDDRKGKIFNDAVSETIGIEEWNKLSPEEQRKTADKIIDDINKTAYEVIPSKATISPATGVEYTAPFIERESMEGITEKMITSKVNSLMAKIPKSQRKDERVKSQIKEKAIELLKDERTNKYRRELSSLQKEEEGIEWQRREKRKYATRR